MLLLIDIRLLLTLDMIDFIQQMERTLRGIHTFPKASYLPRDNLVHLYMTEKHALQVFLQSLTVEQLRLILRSKQDVL